MCREKEREREREREGERERERERWKDTGIKETETNTTHKQPAQPCIQLPPGFVVRQATLVKLTVV